MYPLNALINSQQERLREWTGLTSDVFYDPALIALVPMGFCYPGLGTSGDLPPRPECAPLWHERVIAVLPPVRLTLLVGSYAQDRYLPFAELFRLADQQLYAAKQNGRDCIAVKSIAHYETLPAAAA